MFEDYSFHREQFARGLANFSVELQCFIRELILHKCCEIAYNKILSKLHSCLHIILRYLQEHFKTQRAENLDVNNCTPVLSFRDFSS